MVEPAVFRAGEVTELTLRLIVGAGGIATGGGTLIDLPKSWFILPNQLGKPVQTRNPQAAHFIGVTFSRPGSNPEFTLDHENFDGQLDRFPHMVEIVVGGVPLEEGDWIEVRFTHTTAPFLAGPRSIRVAVDAVGYREYQYLESPTVFDVKPGPPSTLRLVAPSQAVVGEPIDLRLAVTDTYANPVSGLRGNATLRGLGGGPIERDLQESSEWPLHFQWTATESGFVWPSAELETIDSKRTPSAPLTFRADGNPIRILDAAPARLLFWGDLASHSTVSSDGAGLRAFEYARDVSLLDFFAPTEHSEHPNNDRASAVLTAGEWNGLRLQAAEFSLPGKFVSLLGYEVALPEGHREVLFPTDEGAPWGARHLRAHSEGLWQRVAAGEAIGHIPHPARKYHRRIARVDGPEFTDIRYRRENLTLGTTVNWALPVPDEFEKATAIYSVHGSAESNDPEDPLSPVQIQFQPSGAPAGAHSVRDAWAAGHRLGVVAGSDNHFAQPGRASWGLSAVAATGLTRAAIFEGLSARRTWASTGERFYALFEVNGADVGQVLQTEGEISGNMTVAGPRDFVFVEVQRFDTCSGDWSTVRRWERPGRVLEASFTSRVEGCEALFYLRAELSGLTDGRPARLWSSPI
ncbi:MAG: hypothetical protein ACR2NL_11340, partial [Acidimicrobiia bacterium]